MLIVSKEKKKKLVESRRSLAKNTKSYRQAFSNSLEIE